MIRVVIFSLALLSSIAHANTEEEANFTGIDTSVEYVKICSLYGAGYFYIPGTSTCVQASTGVTKKATENATVTGLTQLAYRVAELERRIALLTAEKE